MHATAFCPSSDHPQSCSQGPRYLLDAMSSDVVLPLAWGSQGGVPALLRRVRLFAGLVPAAQVVHWGALATYQVQLRAASAGTCACYQAVLLDAAP
jgi:hypothetical protein